MGRRLGQHFLVRQSVLERIARAACPEGKCGVVVEIGPGRGALTAHLLPLAARLIAIEIDPVLTQYLRAKFRGERNLEIVEGDILRIDLSAWGAVTVAGNLPYYIASPIIEKVLSLGDGLARGVFLVQKEVAERLTAAPGSRDYGYLSVQTQLSSQTEMLFTVAAAAFRPVPKVDSAVVRLTPRAQPLADPKAFLTFASAAFRHKRKTLRNNLLTLYGKEALDAIPEMKRRGEQLSIAEMIALWRRLGG